MKILIDKFILQVHNVFSGLYEVAHETYHPVKGLNLDLARTECLQKTIRNYFQNESFENGEYERIIADDIAQNEAGQINEISNDIYTLISR